MTVDVSFFSYFKDLTGVNQTTVELPPLSTVQDLHQRLIDQFPRLGPMKGSTLIAVGVEYQGPDHRLEEGDRVSLFPPVQGG